MLQGKDRRFDLVLPRAWPSLFPSGLSPRATETPDTSLARPLSPSPGAGSPHPLGVRLRLFPRGPFLGLGLHCDTHSPDTALPPDSRPHRRGDGGSPGWRRAGASCLQRSDAASATRAAGTLTGRQNRRRSRGPAPPGLGDERTGPWTPRQRPQPRCHQPPADGRSRLRLPPPAGSGSASPGLGGSAQVRLDAPGPGNTHRGPAPPTDSAAGRHGTSFPRSRSPW